MSVKPVVRVTALFNKKVGTTDEEFRQYYSQVHARHLLPNLAKYGIISYSQQFITSDAKDKLSKAMGKPAPVSDYDVMGSIVFSSWEAVEAWFKDEENAKHQSQDGPEFADYSNLRFVTGEELMIVEEGKPMI
ncbi:hypothetical protein ACLMJK_008400 [Lecanora helva]